MTTTIRTTMPLVLCGAIGLALSVAGACADAQTDLQIMQVSVLDPPPKVVEVNDRITLPVQMKSMWFQRLHARAFRVGPDGRTPQSHGRLSNGCVVYDSTPLSVRPYAGGQIDLGLVDETWLRRVGTDQLEDETYLLVFEVRPLGIDMLTFPPPQEFVILREEDVERYFEHAYAIRVHGRGVATASLIKVLDTVTMKRGEAFAADVQTPAASPTATIQCVHVVEVSKEGTQVAYLEPCDRRGS